MKWLLGKESCKVIETFHVVEPGRKKALMGYMIVLFKLGAWVILNVPLDSSLWFCEKHEGGAHRRRIKHTLLPKGWHSEQWRKVEEGEPCFVMKTFLMTHMKVDVVGSKPKIKACTERGLTKLSSKDFSNSSLWKSLH